MLLPSACGPLTSALVDALRTGDPIRLRAAQDLETPTEPLVDDDLQLALWICYELH